MQRTEGILRELEAAEAALERTNTHVAGVLRARASRARTGSCSRARSPPSRSAIPTCA